MRHMIALAAALVLCAFVTGAVHAQTDRIKKAEELHKNSPPIVFFIAHGAPDACGAGCDSWIAAEGRFDDDAAVHLRRVLDQAGKRKLPIYFQSPGGSIPQAMEIGRMLRRRGLTAGVARTLPQGCRPNKTIDVCSKAMREEPAQVAELVAAGASCLSACPYALIGATTRLIEPTALLGVHEGLAYFKRVNGVTGRRLDLALQKLETKWDREYSSYIAEMGIGKGLFEVVRQTPFGQLHYLTRSELVEFHIDQREIMRSGWTAGVLDQASIGYAVYNTVPMQAQTVSAAPVIQPRAMTLALSCDYGPAPRYVLTLLRPISKPSSRFDLEFVVSAGGASVVLDSSTSFLTTSHDQLFDVRQTRVRPLVRDVLLEAPTIDLSGKPPVPGATLQPPASAAASAVRYYISNAGAAEAVKAITERCAQK